MLLPFAQFKYQLKLVLYQTALSRSNDQKKPHLGRFFQVTMCMLRIGQMLAVFLYPKGSSAWRITPVTLLSFCRRLGRALISRRCGAGVTTRSDSNSNQSVHPLFYSISGKFIVNHVVLEPFIGVVNNLIDCKRGGGYLKRDS